MVDGEYNELSLRREVYFSELIVLESYFNQAMKREQMKASQLVAL